MTVRHDLPAREDVTLMLDDEILAEGPAELRWHLHDLLCAGARQIHVDCSEATRVGSASIAALLGAHRACRARGGAVVLVRPNRQVTDLLRRTGLWRVFRVDTAPVTDGRVP